MKDFLIDEGQGNYDLQIVNHDFQLTSTVAQYVQQKLKIKLAIFRGEWYLDTNLGLPYITENEEDGILGKAPNLNYIESLYKIAINSVEGVEEILEFEMQIDTQTREFTVDFKVRVTSGEEVSLTV